MKDRETKEILDYDRTHLWHPYTSMKQPLSVFHAVRADGVHIELSDGRRIVDGMSSWWSVIHGYNNPKLNEAVEAQLQHMASRTIPPSTWQEACCSWRPRGSKRSSTAIRGRWPSRSP